MCDAACIIVLIMLHFLQSMEQNLIFHKWMLIVFAKTSFICYMITKFQPWNVQRGLSNTEMIWRHRRSNALKSSSCSCSKFPAWCKDGGVSNAANPRTQTVHVLEKQIQVNHKVGFVQLFASDNQREHYRNSNAYAQHIRTQKYPAANNFILSQSVLEIEVKNNYGYHACSVSSSRYAPIFIFHHFIHNS